MEIVKTTFLMCALMVLFVFVGNLVAGSTGMVVAFVLATAMNFYGYFFSDKIVLSRYHACRVDERSAKGLCEMVKELCKKASLPVPQIYIVPDSTPNAFATGRNPNHAAVAVTEGLLELLDEREVRAVIAHELSHVRHYDILTGSVAAMFAGAIAILANIAQMGAVFGDNRGKNNALVALVVALVMPLVASVIQLSISRSREYAADRGSALITQDPEALISALSKLENYSKGEVLKNVTPQTSHMFIINPLNALSSNISSLFRTHPTTADRIARLREMGSGGSLRRYFES